MISINNLQKKFGEKLAVNIDHYEINQGDMLGLVGNNGAGKTTLFRLMLDLLKADNGNVVINEIDVSQSEDWKNFTGDRKSARLNSSHASKSRMPSSA